MLCFIIIDMNGQKHFDGHEKVFKSIWCVYKAIEDATEKILFLLYTCSQNHRMYFETMQMPCSAQSSSKSAENFKGQETCRLQIGLH